MIEGKKETKYYNQKVIADLIDELTDPEKTEEEIENIFGKMVVLGIKLKK